ncbi:hypothetical protein V5O48_008274 [Marasmius crinis-equi]|uniref:3-carboxymuconate cyclase n=1 Tax=Marasmius crinis-equi TaxID=585013 RepID=A0ABR3FED5_9AGAR
MKLSITVIYASILLSSFSFASPVGSSNAARADKVIDLGTSSGDTVGAAYFITNDPDGNFVVSADIGKDGALTLRQAITTNGFGLHGIVTGPIGPDPLFSQGAVKTSQAAGMLATVNSGSNTISIFSINKDDPAKLDPIGEPVSSGGEFPVSLTFNDAGDVLCALNGGKANGVSCFKVDKVEGLVPAPETIRSLNLNQTTPASGPPNSVSQVIFSEDNKQLVASVKGVPPTPGFLAVWDVNQDGSLSKEFRSVAPAQGGVLPFSMNIIPGKKAIFATDPAIGYDIFDFDVQTLKGTNITSAGRSSANAVDGQMANCWSSYSPKTGNFYLTDAGNSRVTEVKVDDNLTGTVVKFRRPGDDSDHRNEQQYEQGQDSSTIDNDIATVGDKDFMYILSANATRVDVLSIDGPAQAQNIQRLDLAGPGKASGLKISASNLQGMTTFIKK